jgi:hypothetical protein
VLGGECELMIVSRCRPEATETEILAVLPPANMMRFDAPWDNPGVRMSEVSLRKCDLP